MATTTRTTTDARGTWLETLTDGVVTARQMTAESPAFTTERETLRIACETIATKQNNNMARIQTLGMRAARFAKDPVANASDQLTVRLQHELLARLAIATVTDDV